MPFNHVDYAFVLADGTKRIERVEIPSEFHHELVSLMATWNVAKAVPLSVTCTHVQGTYDLMPVTGQVIGMRVEEHAVTFDIGEFAVKYNRMWRLAMCALCTIPFALVFGAWTDVLIHRYL